MNPRKECQRGRRRGDDGYGAARAAPAVGTIWPLPPSFHCGSDGVAPPRTSKFSYNQANSSLCLQIIDFSRCTKLFLKSYIGIRMELCNLIVIINSLCVLLVSLLLNKLFFFQNKITHNGFKPFRNSLRNHSMCISSNLTN